MTTTFVTISVGSGSKRHFAEADVVPLVRSWGDSEAYVNAQASCGAGNKGWGAGSTSANHTAVKLLGYNRDEQFANFAILSSACTKCIDRFSPR